MPRGSLWYRKVAQPEQRKVPDCNVPEGLPVKLGALHIARPNWRGRQAKKYAWFSPRRDVADKKRRGKVAPKPTAPRPTVPGDLERRSLGDQLRRSVRERPDQVKPTLRLSEAKQEKPSCSTTAVLLPVGPEYGLVPRRPKASKARQS